MKSIKNPQAQFVIAKKIMFVFGLFISSFHSLAQPNVVTDIDTNPSNATTSSVSQANDMYQSFTPTQDGRLVRIDLIVRANSVGTRQLDVYDGEGTSGSLLHTQSVTSQAGTNEYELSVPIPVIGGQLYTFALTDTDPALLVGTNYSGGKLMVTFNGSPFEFDADFKILLDIGTNTNLSNRGDFTNEDPITFDLETFGTVVGLDLSVFQVTNGTASSLVEDTPGNHILEVTPSGEGLVSVAMLEGALIIDGIDSDATMASSTYDITPPDNQDLIFINNQLFTAGGQVIFNDPAVTPLVYFAPEGTIDFTPGPTIVQGSIVSMIDPPGCVPMSEVTCPPDPMTGMPDPGCVPMPEVTCSTIDNPVLNAPTTAGEYKLFVLDDAGNISEASEATLFVTTETHATASVITVSDDQLFSGETAEVNFLFLGPVTDFTNDDLSVESGTLSTVISTDGNISFNATFTPNAGVDNTGFAIVIINSQITDGSTAGSGFTLSNEYGVHTLAPAITSIQRQTPTDETTGADEVTFRVTFNVAVENSSVETADFTLSGTAAAEGTLGAPVMVDSKTYDFTVTGLATSNGTIGLDYTGTIHYLEVSNTVSGGDPVDEETFTLRNVILSFDSSPILSVDQGAPYSYPIEVSSNFGEADLNVTAIGLPSWLELKNIDTIRTIAGGGDSFDENIPATNASFIQTINDMEYDSEGNLYFIVGNQIKKVDLNGNISTFAGTTQGFSGDGGQASMAQLNQIIGFGIDGNDNFYVADRQNFRIRKIDNTGIITTIAGTGVNGDSGDGGLAVNAEIAAISLLATDKAGNVYFAHGNRIRKIDTDGMITTYAGGGSSNPSGQQATDARLFFSQSLASDGDGNIYIGQARNIYRVDATTNVITNYAGNGTSGFSGDGGTATAGSIDTPTGLALDNNGTLFMVDAGNHRIRKVATDGVISTIAGDGNNTFFGDGVDALTAGLSQLSGIAVDKTGQVVFSDQSTSFRVVRSIQTNRATLTGTPSQTDVGLNNISLTVSNGVESANQSFTISVANVNDLPELIGAEEAFDATQDVAFNQTVSIRDVDGDLVDTEITASPDWLTAALETNLFTFTSGGAFADIAFNDDAFYLSNIGTNAIFTTDQLGQNLTHLAGANDGSSGFLNGDLTSARFDTPFAIDVASNGDIYVIDQGNHALRKISGNTVSTVAGNGSAGFSDGPCSVTLATFDTPNNLLIAPNGDIYISDAGNGVIRLLSATTGEITTLQDGSGSNLTFNTPYGLALDGNGILYVTDNGGHTVWAIDGTVSTLFAGEQGVLGNVDGSALDARFDEPSGIVTNADGSLLYVAEATGNIRKIEIDRSDVTVSTVISTADTPVGLLINPLNNSLLYGDVGISSIIEAQFSIGISGTPSNDDVGANEISVTLNDGIGTPVMETIQINVANVNDAPEFTSNPPVSTIEREPFTYTLEGMDIDNDELFFSAVSIPDWLTLNDISAPIMEGTPTNSDLGEHMIVLQVSDGDLTAQQSFTLEVLNVPDVIEVTSGLSQTFGIGDEIQFQAGFDGNINITPGSESPSIILETGEVDRVATYVSGGNNDANLIFSYTVQEGDFSSDLDYNSTSIDLGDETTLLSGDGVPANVSLPTAGDLGSLSQTSAIVVDGVLPTITTASVITTNISGTNVATIGDDITITFTSSETLNAVPTVSLGGVAVMVSATTNANEYTGTITVANGTFTEGLAGLIIALEDLAGNTKTIDDTGEVVLIDTLTPVASVVSITSSNNDPTLARVGDEITLTFDLSADVSIGNPEVTVQGNLAAVEVSDAPSSNTFIARYNLTSNDLEGLVSFTLDFSDEAGNVADQIIATTDGSSVSFDRTNPTVEISTDGTLFNDGFQIALNFNEEVSGFTADDLTITNATASNFIGSGNSYVVQINPTIDGEGTIDIASGVAMDAAGNGNDASNTLSIDYDATNPTVELSTGSPALTNSVFDINITFSEEVTGFTASDITLTNATTFDFIGSGSEYFVSINPLEDGEVTIDIASGIALDAAGNGNDESNTISIDYDETNPSVELSTDSPALTNSVFDVNITFSEEVSGFTASDIMLTNATTFDFVGSGSEYFVSINPSEDGEVTIAIASEIAFDASGNGNDESNTISIDYDGTNPSVVISREGNEPVEGDFDISIDFSEDVVGFEAMDVLVSNGSISNFSGSENRYVATITPTGELTTIDIESGVAQDLAGNENIAAETLSVEFNTSKQVQVITIEPIVDQTYGNESFDLVASTDSNLELSFETSGPIALEGNTVTITGTGTASILATQMGNDDFQSANAEVTFEVLQAPLLVIADDQTKVYAEEIPALTYEVSGFVNDEDISVISTLPSLSTTAEQFSDVGEYAIVASNAAADNYSFEYTDGTLTITQAGQEIMVNAVSDKFISDGPFDLEATTTSNLALTYGIEGPASIDDGIVTLSGQSGTVNITIDQVGNVNYAAAETVSLDFQVIDPDKVDQIITFSEIEDKTYGDSFMIMASSNSGLDVSYTVVSGQATIDAGELTVRGVGEVIVMASQEGNDTYNPANVSRSFNVDKVLLSVVAEDKSKVYNEPLPDLTYTISGFVLGEDASVLTETPTISTSASQTSDVGTYEITAMGAVSDNYTIDYQPGSLTIAKAVASISITNLALEETGAPQQPAITTNPEGLNFTVTYNGNTEAPSLAGSYDVVVTIDEINYEGVETATFTLSKVLGFDDIQSLEVSVYPNPVVRFFIVETTQDFQVDIYSISGMLELKSSTNKQTDISALAEGVYIIRILDTNGNLLKSEQLIKQ